MVLGISEDGTTAGMAAVEMPWPLAVPIDSSSSSSSDGVRNAGEAAVANGKNYSSSGAAAATAAAEAKAAVVAVNGVVADASGSAGCGMPTAAAAAAINKYLREAHCIEVPVACVGGRLFVRISAQIYNNVGDYQALADAVLGLAAAAARQQ
jgi:hypothetical protein